MKTVIGIILAFTIGVFCRLSGIPVPAPPVIVGALLVVAMTVGYILAGRFNGQRSDKQRKHYNGPTDRSLQDERKKI